MITNYKELIIQHLDEESEKVILCVLNRFGYILEDIDRESLTEIKLHKKTNTIYSNFEWNGGELELDATSLCQ